MALYVFVYRSRPYKHIWAFKHLSRCCWRHVLTRCAAYGFPSALRLQVGHEGALSSSLFSCEESPGGPAMNPCSHSKMDGLMLHPELQGRNQVLSRDVFQHHRWFFIFLHEGRNLSQHFCYWLVPDGRSSAELATVLTQSDLCTSL